VTPLCSYIFYGVAIRNEREANLSDFLTMFSHTLPLAKSYREVFLSNEMKTVVASMYIEIVDLLERATKYYCIGSLGTSPSSSAYSKGS
jgi:hypothetical protein